MDKTRKILYSIAGIYLIYLSYKLLFEISKTDGVAKVASIVFAILFAGIGIALLGLNIYKSLKSKDSETILEETELEEDEGVNQEETQSEEE